MNPTGDGRLADSMHRHSGVGLKPGTSFGGGRGGAIAPLNLKNSDFFVFLHTIFFIHILPPPHLGSRSKF